MYVSTATKLVAAREREESCVGVLAIYYERPTESPTER